MPRAGNARSDGPVEQARALRALMDRNGWSTHQVARELAVDQSSVVRALALIELPPTVQEQVEQGALSPATAYEISKVEDAGEQISLAGRVVAEGMSRAETVAIIRERKNEGKVTSRVFRRAAGCTITVENARGVNAGRIRAALIAVLGRLGEGRNVEA
jgi:ParB family chromosome partitioning protein